MSAAVAYDPALFVVERAHALSSRVGEYLIGLSRLGEGSTLAWAPIEVSSFTTTSSYNVQDNVLIVDADTASVSMSYWEGAGSWSEEYPLYSGDQVRAIYDGKVIFLGTVDVIGIEYVADPEAAKHGAARRVTFRADLLGTYAAMMGRRICHGRLPAETPIQRIRRWCTVTGW